MGVELGAARLGIVEVAPGDEMDAPDPGLGGDGRQDVGVRAAPARRGPPPARGGTGPESSPIRSG